MTSQRTLARPAAYCVEAVAEHIPVDHTGSDSCTLAVVPGAILDASSLVLPDLGLDIRLVAVIAHCTKVSGLEDTSAPVD